MAHSKPRIMTRTEWNIIALALAVSLVFGLAMQAHAAPKPRFDPFGPPYAVGTPLPSPPIRIQCPCDLHVRQQDGVITLSGAGTLTVGPKTTDYTGGHWESDAPVSFDNHAPEPKKDNDR